ncbi:uncharacterized protein N7498_001643 [Penicillium cinerascens]|uniref:Uncharacterized protein n=1 Tax=Penicillium cinerascens TaxID=70096 RepID=A0A9W9N8Q9_9EURO|nr:uncharacterized protein N7498_001643 [Penicillium cinerascens]KAJ5215236.1 hypothetical protein N7498_001643 [Penicillium cinerascens]
MLDTDTDSSYIINKALKLLRNELKSRSSASTTFPPVLTEAQIRASIAQYQSHIEDSSKQGVCLSCGRFVPILEIIEMEDSDPLLLPLATHLDYCGKHSDDQQQIPSLSYRIWGQATLTDHWHDPSYFTGAFPTLFPLGISGHLDERSFDVSLSSFAEWALKHHSRRFARHRIFIYLIYDVLLIRKSSLANKLVLQRRH